jgi:hypothetical protein
MPQSVALEGQDGVDVRSGMHSGPAGPGPAPVFTLFEATDYKEMPLCPVTTPEDVGTSLFEDPDGGARPMTLCPDPDPEDAGTSLSEETDI